MAGMEMFSVQILTVTDLDLSVH